MTTSDEALVGMTEKDFRKYFNKNHLAKLVREIEAETHEGGKRYTARRWTKPAEIPNCITFMGVDEDARKVRTINAYTDHPTQKVFEAYRYKLEYDYGWRSFVHTIYYCQQDGSTMHLSFSGFRPLTGKMIDGFIRRSITSCFFNDCTAIAVL